MSGRGGFLVIDREFDKGYKRIPILLVIIHVVPKNLFDGSIHAFSLTIRLGVKSCAHSKTNVKKFHQRTPEMTGKAGVAIRNDLGGESMVFEYMIKELL